MNLNNVDKNLKSLNKTLGNLITLATSLAVVNNYASDLAPDKTDWVSVPELYSKGYEIHADEAIKMLDDKELKSTRCELNIADADPKYRNCIPYQVIETKPKAKEKVPKGTFVYVKYITPEVIEESRRLFVEKELQKEQLRLEKNVRREERKERVKERQSKLSSAVKDIPKRIPQKKKDEGIILIETKENLEDGQMIEK